MMMLTAAATTSTRSSSMRCRSAMRCGSRMRCRMRHLRSRLVVRMHLWLRVIHRTTNCRTGSMIRCATRMVPRRTARMIPRRITRMIGRRRVGMRRIRSRTNMPRVRRRVIVQSHRPRYRGRSRTPMIDIGERTPVLMRRLLMVHLHRRSRNMVLIHRHLLLCRRPRLHATGATIETCAAIIVDDHCTVDIRIMDHGSIYPGNRGIVTKMAAIPLATAIPYTTITKPIVNPAIKSNMRTPIAAMPAIGATGPAPIARSPQKSYSRRRRPVTRHPVISISIIPGPVTRYPKITVHRTKRLLIDRYGRRCNMYGNSNADLSVYLTSRKTQG